MLMIENCRVNNSWGDGMQFNNGEGQACTNVLVYNNFVRGCRYDDAIALTSSSYHFVPPVTAGTVKNNITVASVVGEPAGHLRRQKHID